MFDGSSYVNIKKLFYFIFNTFTRQYINKKSASACLPPPWRTADFILKAPAFNVWLNAEASNYLAIKNTPVGELGEIPDQQDYICPDFNSTIFPAIIYTSQAIVARPCKRCCSTLKKYGFL